MAECCDSHRVVETPNGPEMLACCDPMDCGPCCKNCPTCPTVRLTKKYANPYADERAAMKEKLWNALLAKGEEIRKAEHLNPGSRSQGMFSGYDAHPNHLAVTAHFGFSAVPDDGSERNYLITARPGIAGADVKFDVKHWMSHHEEFWDQQLADRDGAVVVRGTHYRIVPDRTDGRMQGFGGRQFTVKFHDGRTVETRNLWYQGVVPAVYRDRLPDNADLTSH